MSARVDGSQILNPGLLRHQITWQQKTVSGQNASGEDVFTWTDFLTCRASVESTSGREFARVMERWAEAEFVIDQHFSLGILPDMRIAWYVDGAVIYLDVLNISDPVNNRRSQEIICKTYVEGGFQA